MLASLQDAEAIYVAKGIRERPDLSPRGHNDHAFTIEGLRARDAARMETPIARHLTTTLTPYIQG
jgi:hypothetical protein